MRKIYLSGVILALTIPLTTIAIVTPPNTLYRKSSVSGEQSQTGSTKTGTGRTNRDIASKTNVNAIKEVARPKSRLETAAERQRQREADLDVQHKAEEESADRQRAIKAAYDAQKRAEEEARQEALRYRQPGETIESYCARAQTQGFLSSFLHRNTVQECIDMLNRRKRLGREIARRTSSNQSNTERTLRRLCNEEYEKTGNIPTFCEEYVTPSGSGSTQTGGTLTRSR